MINVAIQTCITVADLRGNGISDGSPSLFPIMFVLIPSVFGIQTGFYVRVVGLYLCCNLKA